MISSLIDATTDNIASVESYDNYTAVQVQYNPHSIRFQGSQGVQRRAGVGAQDEYVQTQMPTETHMMVQLEFDDTNITDAFMFDRLNILTSGGAVQTIEKAVSSALGKEYSVQNISEVFVAAMVRPVTRYVAFIWNKMVFWGELNHVSVRYTMFNTSGSPIRSQVSLRIRQDRAEGDATNAYATEKDWEKAFTTMFSKTTKSNAFGVTNKVSNLIGL
jgi:hypothetical protein